jgi:hypothetical protein
MTIFTGMNLPVRGKTDRTADLGPCPWRIIIETPEFLCQAAPCMPGDNPLACLKGMRRQAGQPHPRATH